MWTALEYAEKTFYGFYDKVLGGFLALLYQSNVDVLGPHYKREFNIDIKKSIEEMKPITINKIEEQLTQIFYGFSSKKAWLTHASCCYKIGGIRTPTLFFNTLDDPLIPAHVIDQSSINSNPNCFLATSNHGGHLGHYESCFSEDQWWVFPVLDYLNILKY